MTSFGEIEVPRTHCLTQSGGTFRMSPYCQELVCYMGQDKVFESGSETLNKLRGIQIPGKQIERISHYYGEVLEEQQNKAIEKEEEKKYDAQEHEKEHYVMVDESMALTREEKWKGVKLGRIFKAEDNVAIQENRNMITESTYVAHVGGHKEFKKKMEYYLDALTLLIFVADGAGWIWNWVKTMYPHAIQILDFFHAKEHLCAFALDYFSEQTKRERWIEKQSDLLLEGKIEQVITHIQQLHIENTKMELRQARDSLVKYYQTNIKRMRYKYFREHGWLIGSGPIESANRTVLQQRMKLSGQRWTKKGLQQIATLRSIHKSNQWDKVIELTKKAA